jgi:uncharacterized protein (DUF305 family)
MRRAVLSVAACLAVSCGAANQTRNPPIVQPGSPGEATRDVTAAQAAEAGRPKYTASDVTFMQGMIHHHAQAVEMVELLKTRTNNPDMRKLGDRIEISQTDEIGMMRKWLHDRGAPAPEAGGAHQMPHMDMPGMSMPASRPEMPPMGLMPGMLTPEEMAQLAAAKGPEFDRLFLAGMIKHHGGALTMVKDLFATPGAAQDSDIFAFASDVDADQRMEIARMEAMLKELQK